ncbi:hypothetical protein [Tabrizicola sp.]|uniref:hypothetical protein n=1 Tax=Tabrizicola sp. TaxID=2005166 RepID=UPI002FDD1717
MLEALALMTGRPTDPDAGKRLDRLRRAAWQRLGLTRDRGMLTVPGFPAYFGAAFVFRESPRDRAEPRDWFMIQVMDDSEVAGNAAYHAAYRDWLLGHMRALHGVQPFPFAVVCPYDKLPLPDSVLAGRPGGDGLCFTEVDGHLIPRRG